MTKTIIIEDSTEVASKLSKYLSDKAVELESRHDQKWVLGIRHAAKCIAEVKIVDRSRLVHCMTCKSEKALDQCVEAWTVDGDRHYICKNCKAVLVAGQDLKLF